MPEKRQACHPAGRRALTQGAGGGILDAGTLNCAVAFKGAETFELSVNPAERQPRASDQAAA